MLDNLSFKDKDDTGFTQKEKTPQLALWEVNALKISAVCTTYQCQKRWISVPRAENQCHGHYFSVLMVLIFINDDTDFSHITIKRK